MYWPFVVYCMLCVELELVFVTPDTGLSPSPGKLLGGVSKLLTLAIVVGACDD
jgi:hypothetical protein